MKRQTISTRFSEFTKAEPFWARTTLILLALSILGLWVHLWVLTGLLRTLGLISMIAFVSMAEVILWWKRVFWWFYFWLGIILLVIGFECASYFFGS